MDMMRGFHAELLAKVRAVSSFQFQPEPSPLDLNV
jgi:hypothetical protein